MASDEFRIEHDTMGEVKVPASARWGAQTQRAVDNFPISGLRIDRALIGALASIKGAASIVNLELGVLPEDVALAIHDVGRRGVEGRVGRPVPGRRLPDRVRAPRPT